MRQKTTTSKPQVAASATTTLGVATEAVTTTTEAPKTPVKEDRNYLLMHHDYLHLTSSAARNVDQLILLLQDRVNFYKGVSAKGGKLVAIDDGHIVFVIPGHNTPSEEACEVFQTVAIDTTNLPDYCHNTALDGSDDEEQEIDVCECDKEDCEFVHESDLEEECEECDECGQCFVCEDCECEVDDDDDDSGEEMESADDDDDESVALPYFIACEECKTAPETCPCCGSEDIEVEGCDDECGDDGCDCEDCDCNQACDETCDCGEPNTETPVVIA